MSEEQNDSPAFRLRPRRAAPKSYYTVRLEYSANPAAFIRERPRGGNSSGGGGLSSGTKRKVFTQKTGSNSTKIGLTQDTTASGQVRVPTILTKEEREREEKRAALHRQIKESITTNTLISPFIGRLRLDELEPESCYEHNYITLQILRVEESSDGRVMLCSCQGVDSLNPREQDECVNVYLYDEYAHKTLVKPDKIISIAKFRTGPSRDGTSSLQFDVIVKYDEFVELSTGSILNRPSSPSSNLASSASGDDALTSTANSSKRRPLIPFVSITDMIDLPTEPFVEMSTSSPPITANHPLDIAQNHENQDSKKVKFTANLSD